MKTLSLIGLMLICFHAQAQKKIKEIRVSDDIVFATVDRPGDLYIVTRSGQIQKFDKDGQLVVVYKADTAPTLFDPRDGARLFAYFREHQQYNYYSPSFEILSSYRIDPAFAIQPSLIAPSGEFKLWVLDAADHSLKKVNTRQSEVEIEVTIDSTLIRQASDFTYAREYQGYAFLLNPEKGIFVFNGLGRHIKTIEQPGLSNFNFLGEELYYLKDGFIEFFDLFTGQSRRRDIGTKADVILLTDERLFSVKGQVVEVFEFTP